ncbi:MAG: hypothetical protein ABSF80_08420 [Chitinispirillaceae bacterium]
MKTVGKMTLGELAAFVCSHLRKNGIRAVLSGGACVSIYSHSRYQSSDLDFIANFSASRAKMREVLGEIGFAEHNRYFRHPDTEIFIEFPPGPLTVGEEPVKEIADMKFSTGHLSLISPTDCIKDRLAGYFYWKDLQCLEQAVLVAQNNPIDLPELRRWSENEGKLDEFKKIAKRLA